MCVSPHIYPKKNGPFIALPKLQDAIKDFYDNSRGDECRDDENIYYIDEKDVD